MSTILHAVEMIATVMMVYLAHVTSVEITRACPCPTPIYKVVAVMMWTVTTETTVHRNDVERMGRVNVSLFVVEEISIATTIILVR